MRRPLFNMLFIYFFLYILYQMLSAYMLMRVYRQSQGLFCFGNEEIVLNIVLKELGEIRI